MKQQIRRGTFETNSSSTHSMQIIKEDNAKSVMDVIYNILREEISKQFENCDYDSLYVIEQFEKTQDDKNILLLKGFSVEDGNESSIVIYGITTPMFKLQYYYMLLKQYITYIHWKDHIDSAHALMKYQEFQWFKEYIMNCKYFSQYDEILADNFDIYNDHDIYVENSNKEIFQSKESLFAELDKIFDINTCIIYKDIPYSMYNEPKFYVI